jgi:hypothetical protein
MKLFITVFLSLIITTVNAQSFGTLEQRARLEDVKLNDSSITQKWFITKYSGLSASFIGFRGGSASVIAAPMGIQLNRALSNNVYAFAGVEIAPAYITMNPFGQPNVAGKFSNSLLNANSSQFQLNPAAFIGLGYTNDARTFQIQGRVSLQQGNYFTNPAGFGSFNQVDRQMRNLPMQGNRAFNF